MKSKYFERAAALLAFSCVAWFGLWVGVAWFEQRAGAQPGPGAGILNPQRIIDSTQNNTTTGTWTNRILGSGQAGGGYQANPIARVASGGAKEVSFELSFEAASANSGLVTVFFGRNNSGLQGSTNMEQFALLTATANGTAHITVCTNFGPSSLGGGYQYFYVMAISNGGVGFLTNYTVTTGLK
jgi:hypothetical protein